MNAEELDFYALICYNRPIGKQPITPLAPHPTGNQMTYWIQQRNLYENLSADFEDRGEPTPRHITEQLCLVKATIKAHQELLTQLS